MVVSYNGNYARLSAERPGFNSPYDRQYEHTSAVCRKLVKNRVTAFFMAPSYNGSVAPALNREMQGSNPAGVTSRLVNVVKLDKRHLLERSISKR